jgi:hypothetical protein
MTDAITIISPRTLTEAKELATTLANANTMPAALKKSPADVLAIVMAGAELGLAPMQSIRGIMLIEGKPTLSADAMGALVKASPLCEYLQCTVTTDKIATFKTQRKGDPDPTTFSFTIEEANQAGLNKPTSSGKPSNWQKFPKAMLRARAQSGICRLVYSDLMLGVYDPDELEPEAAPRVEKPVASTVETLKEELKAKRKFNVVDVPAKPSPPSAPFVADETPEDDPATIGYGKNATMRLVDVTPTELEWYVRNAEQKATAAENDEREMWAARYARYLAEQSRRSQGEGVAS